LEYALSSANTYVFQLSALIQKQKGKNSTKGYLLKFTTNYYRIFTVGKIRKKTKDIIILVHPKTTQIIKSSTTKLSFTELAKPNIQNFKKVENKSVPAS
jgi:hypothetical protein